MSGEVGAGCRNRGEQKRGEGEEFRRAAARSAGAVDYDQFPSYRHTLWPWALLPPAFYMLRALCTMTLLSLHPHSLFLSFSHFLAFSSFHYGLWSETHLWLIPNVRLGGLLGQQSVSSSIKNKQTNNSSLSRTRLFLFSEISASLSGASRQLLGCWAGIVGLEAMCK